MRNLAGTIKDLMNEATTNSHLVINRDTQVKYPYLTYAIETDGPEGNQETMTIQVQLFDYGTSYTQILGLQEELENVFHKRRLTTDNHFLQFVIGTSGNVPTGTENVMRRDIFIQGKIDWRNKQWL